MSEKRFVLCKKGDVEYIEDNCCVQLYGFDVLCEMLNEQQATISRLKEENEYYRKSRDKWRTKAQKVDYWKHKSLELYKLLRGINLSDKEWEQFLNIKDECDDYLLWKKEKDKHIGWKAL